MVATIEILRDDVIGTNLSVQDAYSVTYDQHNERTDGGRIRDQAVVCAGGDCIRPDPDTSALTMCAGDYCTPIEGDVKCADGGYMAHPRDPSRCVPACINGTKYSDVIDRCVGKGDACPGGAHDEYGVCRKTDSVCEAPLTDVSNLAFAYDSSGSCLATTNCKTGFKKHPLDQRCVSDCGNNRIFSYLMNSCVTMNESCPSSFQKSDSGFLQAFDEFGRCTDTNECADGYMKHPRDASRCVPRCTSGTNFSDVIDECVTLGYPCSGGAHDDNGICRKDGESCQSTPHPDLNDVSFKTTARTSDQLEGAILKYSGGMCLPTGMCANASQKYDWSKGGCYTEETSIKCPPGFTKVSDSKCTRKEPTPDTGRREWRSRRIDGVDPKYKVRSRYEFRKGPNWRDGDFHVVFPGGRGANGEVRNNNVKTVPGNRSQFTDPVSGSSSYEYKFWNNDGTGNFYFEVERV